MVGRIHVQFDPAIPAGAQLPASADGLGAGFAEGERFAGTLAAITEGEVVGDGASAVGFDDRLVVEGLRAGAADDGVVCREGHIGDRKIGRADLELHPELGEIDAFIILQFKERVVASGFGGRGEVVGDVQNLAGIGVVRQLAGLHTLEIIPAVINDLVIGIPGAGAGILETPALGEGFARFEGRPIQRIFTDEGYLVAGARRDRWRRDGCGGGLCGNGGDGRQRVGGLDRDGSGLLRVHRRYRHGDGGRDGIFLFLRIHEESAG